LRARASSRGTAARSCTLAAVTDQQGYRLAQVSTTTWRLMPSSFLAASKPRGPRTGDALIEQESITLPEARRAAVGMADLAARLGEGTVRGAVAAQRRKCLWAAEQETAKSWGSIRQVQPVRLRLT